MIKNIQTKKGLLHMSNVSDWKVVKKLQCCNKSSIIIGVVIGVLVITLLVLAIIFKAKLLKKMGLLGCDGCELEFEDEYLEFDEDDEDEFI